jgi:ApbE superfamily uncharacterized protein (UPF0280 family)
VGQLRTYHNWVKYSDLESFRVADRESDLQISAKGDFRVEALAEVKRCRADLENYIDQNLDFLVTLDPIDVSEGAPSIVVKMAKAAKKAGVGPMAAVAGAIAEEVGHALMKRSAEVIVENGGDIFIHTKKPRRIGIYAGDSPLSGKLAIEIAPEDSPMGICTSSGTVGYSLNFGLADAVSVLSSSTVLADAAATAVSNIVQTADDIPAAIKLAQSIDGVAGVVIIIGDKLGVWGKVKLSEVDQHVE